MQIDALANLLAHHFHQYDSDCGVDGGCSCGAIDDYDESDIQHEDHLAAVIREAFDVRARENASNG